VLGVVQERRALREVRSLDDLVAPSARVTREGRDTWVPTRELVRGDVLRLTAGDVVGADARLVRSVQLQMDESLLTGEFQPSDRDSEAVSPGSTPMADRTGMVHASSTVLRSSGEAVVVATGVATVIGQVARLVGGRRSPLAPLQRVEAIRADLQRRTEELVADVVGEEVAAGGAPRVVRTTIAEGPAAEVLLQRARKAQLLVVGSRGRGAIRGLLLGSVALHCAMHAPGPVMLVHPQRSRSTVEPGPAPAMAEL